MEGLVKRGHLFSSLAAMLLVMIPFITKQFSALTVGLLIAGVVMYAGIMFVSIQTHRYRDYFSEWSVSVKAIAILLLVPGFVFTLLSLAVWQEFQNSTRQ